MLTRKLLKYLVLHVYIYIYIYALHSLLSDPIPLLEQALSHQSRLMSLSDLEVENIKLRETLDEYNKEFAHVKNQGI